MSRTKMGGGHWGGVGFMRKKSNRMQKIWDFLAIT